MSKYPIDYVVRSLYLVLIRDVARYSVSDGKVFISFPPYQYPTLSSFNGQINDWVVDR